MKMIVDVSIMLSARVEVETHEGNDVSFVPHVDELAFTAHPRLLGREKPEDMQALYKHVEARVLYLLLLGATNAQEEKAGKDNHLTSIVKLDTEKPNDEDLN